MQNPELLNVNVGDLYIIHINTSFDSDIYIYVGHLESKERLRIQPAQLFNFSS